MTVQNFTKKVWTVFEKFKISIERSGEKRYDCISSLVSNTPGAIAFIQWCLLIRYFRSIFSQQKTKQNDGQGHHSDQRNGGLLSNETNTKEKFRKTIVITQNLR